MKIEDEFFEKVLNIKLNAKVTTSTPNIKEEKLESNLTLIKNKNLIVFYFNLYKIIKEKPL